MLPTPANIKYAGKIATEIRSKIEVGVFNFEDYFPKSTRSIVSEKGSFADFLDHWYSQLELKSSTLKSYLGMKDNFWKPKIGHLRLTAVKHSDITKALKEGGWKSGKTRNNYLSMISAALELAVDDELIDKNPCTKIKPADWQRPLPDPFSADETEMLISHLEKTYDEQVHNLVEFWFFTGLRTSEIIGLEWKQVDLNKRVIRIDQGFVIDQMESSTKTSRDREVKLNSRALGALERHKAWTLLAGGRVFHDPGTGQPWAYEQNFRKTYWTPALKKLGIRYRRPYNMRSTCATRGLMAGVNPAWMAKQLGHSTEVFFRDYAKWIDGQRDNDELEKIERQIQPALAGVRPAFGTDLAPNAALAI